MHTGTQRKYVIKPINRFADRCPARRVGEDESSLLDLERYFIQYKNNIIHPNTIAMREKKKYHKSTRNKTNEFE